MSSHDDPAANLPPASAGSAGGAAPGDGLPSEGLPAAAPRSYADEVVGFIPALRIFARSLCRDPVEADDLVQETLLRGLEKHQLYQPGTNLRAWLFTILRNRFYTNRLKLGREVSGDALTEDQPGSADGQYWHLRLQEMHLAIHSLPPQFRETIMLVGVLGESYQNAAEILGCDIGTVKSRMNRARAALRDKLEDPGA